MNQVARKQNTNLDQPMFWVMAWAPKLMDPMHAMLQWCWWLADMLNSRLMTSLHQKALQSTSLKDQL